jgi:hypothetical protein
MSSLVVIYNLYAVRSILSPLETDPPLLVNQDALLSISISTQRLEAVTGKIHKNFKPGGHLKDSVNPFAMNYIQQC